MFLLDMPMLTLVDPVRVPIWHRVSGGAKNGILVLETGRPVSEPRDSLYDVARATPEGSPVLWFNQIVTLLCREHEIQLSTLSANKRCH